jgi:uncharacterized protein (TIGR00251 family)
MRIKISVRPNAPKNEISEGPDGILKLRITAPPEHGKANAEICRFLARALKLPPGSVFLKTGHSSKPKIIEIDMGPEDFGLRLKELIG